MRLSFLFVSVFLVGSVGACGDDEPNTRDTVDADVVDTSDTSEPDSVDSADAPDVDVDDTADTAPDSSYPDVVYSDAPLAVDPDFDPTFAGHGDQVVTTLLETLRPRYGLTRYTDDAGRLRVPVTEIGRLHPQPGEPHRLRDQLALADLTADLDLDALPARTSIFFGLVLADPQLVDQDSPAQVAKNAAQTLGNISLPAYAPHGELGIHINDALIRSADRFQDVRPFDLVVIAGDHIENTQENELAELHTVLNGGRVSADSGALDDPHPGPDNDAFDPIVAAGFRAGTPWISTIGNHDVNVEGNFPPGMVEELTDDLDLRAELDSLADPLGLAFPYASTSDQHPALFPHAIRSAFRVDPDHFNPAMMTSPEELQSLTRGPTPADPARKTMGPCGFIQKTFVAPGTPIGHGFTQHNADSCTGFYTYDPTPGIRIVSLDLGPHEGGSNGILAPPYKNGTLDSDKVGDPLADQIAFLDAALADAEADGVAVIVISHQASDALVEQSQLQDLAFLLSGFPDLVDLINRYSPIPVDPVTPEAFRKRLAASPNVIAHIAGHNHRNRVRAICADGTDRAEGQGRCPPGPNGETGYWEITTSAGIDLPHEARFVEVVQMTGASGGRLGALYLTMLDPRIPAGSFSERARFISTAHAELDGGFGGLGDLGDRNLFLPFALSESLAAAWSSLGTTPITSETALHEPLPALGPLPSWPAR